MEPTPTLGIRTDPVADAASEFTISTPPPSPSTASRPPKPSTEMLLTELDRALETAVSPQTAVERAMHWIAELSQSPVLFFRYQRGRDLALLTHVEGMGDTLLPGSLHFSIQPPTVETVLKLAERFELASFGRFVPLNNMILKDLGVAHFEAWALIPFVHLDPRGTAFPLGFSPELYGIVVIVHSGIETALHRKTLLGALKKTGYHLGLTHEFTHPGSTFSQAPSIEH